MNLENSLVAREALAAIPADLPREDWVRVGMAAKAAGLYFDDFDQWSKSANNYDPRDARSTWRSFKSGKGIGAGTLFYEAKKYGWRMEKKETQTKQTRITKMPVTKQSTKQSPAQVWARCQPATASHGYIEAKRAAGAPLDGLRVLPTGDSLCIAGQVMAGSLVVPAYGSDGVMKTLQLIPPPGAGKKLNLPGAPMAGASFTVGNVVPDGMFYIGESVGVAWACWQAGGHAAVSCFGWGNVASVVADLRRRYPKGQLVLLPDVGKELSAHKIAAEYGCKVAAMPAGESTNFDANDLALRDGHDVLEELLEQASEPAKPAPLLKPVSVCDVLTNPSPPPAFVWAGYLPRGLVTLLGAHGGIGKSTIVLMLAVATVTGRPLFGVPTEVCPVVFVSLEDSGSIVRHRLARICQAWGVDPMALSERLHIVDGTDNPELFEADNRNAGDVTSTYTELSSLVQSTGAGLVVVDNASDAFGGDEINRRQVRGFIPPWHR